MNNLPADLVVVGRVSGVYGVRGWCKVFSYTDPRDGILNYSPWLIQIGGQWQALKLEQGRAHGKGVVAQLEGYVDRDQVASLVGADIAIRREQLPATTQGQYYWSDLVGLRVVSTTGVELGIVDHIMATGANDVMVLTGERERLIPFVMDDVVRAVDLEQGVIEVDWHADD